MINPNDSTHCGKAGADMIKSFESLVLTAYVDTHAANGAPIYAIGWGHTGLVDGKKIVAGLTITEAKAEVLFEQNVLEVEQKIKELVMVKLNQNQFDALTSCFYNVSTAHAMALVHYTGIGERLLTQEESAAALAKVPAELMKYDVSGRVVLRGLTRRRAQEAALFDTPV